MKLFSKKKDIAVEQKGTVEYLQGLLDNTDPLSEKYDTLLNRIDKLTKIRKENKPDRIKKEAWLMAGTNLAGILLIMNHERINVITTKALGFVSKPKI